MKMVTHSVEETEALGKLLGRLAPVNMTLALHGTLGAGKTHLTRGIAQGAEVDDPTLVTSPTYVLLNIYSGPKPVYHLDAYRISGSDDFAAVGFEELLTSDGVVVVEWAEKIAGLLPTEYLNVTIEAGEGEEERVFELKGVGEGAGTLAREVERAWADGR